MIQKYTSDVNRDPNEDKAFEVFKAMVEPFVNEVKEFYDNYYCSPMLGQVLFETNASPIVWVWNNPRIQVVYPFWHNLYMDLQTFDNLVLFINALYKKADTTITITAPLALAFGIDVNSEEPVWWNRDGRFNLEVIPGDLADIPDDKEAQLFVTDDSIDENNMVGIVFDTVAININGEAFTKILRDVVYPGLYYTTDVIK